MFRTAENHQQKQNRFPHTRGDVSGEYDDTEPTVKNLFRPHTSLPPNELLAKPMYLKGYIEKTGTGTGDVIDYCRQWKLSSPEFVEESDFRVILRRKTTTGTTEETSPQTTRKTTGKNQEFEARGALEKIRGLIVMNPRITIPEIARISDAEIQARIRPAHGVLVVPDRDLALLYGVDTGQLNRQVKRNIDRFPADFSCRRKMLKT